MNQAGDLLPGVAADFHQIADDEAPISPRPPAVVEAKQGALDPSIASLFALDREGHGLGTFEEQSNLLQRREFMVVHEDHHVPS